MTSDIAHMATLLVRDPDPLVQLAMMGQLDALLTFRQIIIVDEMAYAVDLRYAAADPDDPHRLQRWITEQAVEGRVSCPTTWVGEDVAAHREVAHTMKDRHLAEIAVSQYLRTLDSAGDMRPMAMLIEDSHFSGRRVREIVMVDLNDLLTMLSRDGSSADA